MCACGRVRAAGAEDDLRASCFLSVCVVSAQLSVASAVCIAHLHSSCNQTLTRHCVEGCLRSCTRTTETRCRSSTAAPSWSTGSRPTERSPPGPSTPKTSCRRCRATTAMLSQVIIEPPAYRCQKVIIKKTFVQMGNKGGSISSEHI